MQINKKQATGMKASFNNRIFIVTEKHYITALHKLHEYKYY